MATLNKRPSTSHCVAAAIASTLAPLSGFASTAQVTAVNVLPPYTITPHTVAVPKRSDSGKQSAAVATKAKPPTSLAVSAPNRWPALVPDSDVAAQTHSATLLRLAQGPAAPAPASAAPAPASAAPAPAAPAKVAPSAAPAASPGTSAPGNGLIGNSISSTITQVVPNSELHLEPEATVPAGPMNIAPPPTPSVQAVSPASGGMLNTAPIPSVGGMAGPIEAPRTASGLVAPPIRVPPPPELLPQPVPDVPAGAGVGGPGTVAANTVIDLNQALALGLQNETTISVARESVNSAAGLVRQQAAGLKPSLTASGDYEAGDSSSTSRTVVTNNGGIGNPGNTSTVETGGGFSRTYSAGLTLSQLIYDGGHVRSSVKSAEAAEAAAKANVAASREQVVLAVKQGYFGLLGAEGIVAADRGTVAAQRTHLDEALAIYRAGTSAQSDVIQAQTNLAEALLALANAQNSEAIARVGLNLALGLDPRYPTQVADTGALTADVPALNDLVAQALATRPDIIQQQQTVVSDQFSLRVAQTNNNPVVDADGTLGIEGGSNVQSTNGSGVGISATWPLFDSGLTKGLVEQAQATLNTAKLNLTALLRTATSDVSQGYLNVANARQRVLTSNAEVTNAQESLRLAEGQYRAGVVIFLQVSDAQAALATALADQVNATYGLNNALANLDFAVHGGHSNSQSAGTSSNLYTSSIPSTASTTTTTVSAGSGSGTTAISTTTTGTSTTP